MFFEESLTRRSDAGLWTHRGWQTDRLSRPFCQDPNIVTVHGDIVVFPEAKGSGTFFGVNVSASGCDFLPKNEPDPGV